jgi:hypothetical protein
MITASTFGKVAVVAGAIALAVGLGPHGGASRPTPSRMPLAATGGARLDATSDAEARRLRRVTRALGAELRAAARCGTVACVTPALRRAGIGGRTTAMLARGVMAGVPAGRCREYLFGLEMANDAAGDEARWLLPLLYGPGRQDRRRAVAGQMELAGRMLHRTARAAAADVCAPGADGPAS